MAGLVPKKHPAEPDSEPELSAHGCSGIRQFKSSQSDGRRSLQFLIANMLHLTQLAMTKCGFAVEESGWALKQRCYLRKEKKRFEEWSGGGRLLSVTPPRPLAKCGHKAGRPNKDDGPAEDTRASCFQARFMRTFTSYKSMFCRPAAVGASSASPNHPKVTAEDGRTAAQRYSVSPNLTARPTIRTR